MPDTGGGLESFKTTASALVSVSARFHGIVANIFLSSAVLGLVLLYFVNHADKDKPWLRYLVLVIGVLCVAETCVLWNVIDVIHVVNLYSPFAAENRSSYIPSERLMGVAVILATLITVTTQGYFARRAWLVLNNSVVFAVMMGLLLAFAASMGIGLGYHIYRRIWGKFSHTLGTCYFAAAFVIDVLNTGILLKKLLSYRANTEYRNTRTVLMRYILIIINSSGLSTSFALTTLLLSELDKTEELYMAFFWPIAKIYALSLMVQLITRNHQDGNGSVTAGPRSTTRSNAITASAINLTTRAYEIDQEKGIDLAEFSREVPAKTVEAHQAFSDGFHTTSQRDA